jgi:hypothetical protein
MRGEAISGDCFTAVMYLPHEASCMRLAVTTPEESVFARKGAFAKEAIQRLLHHFGGASYY